MEVSLLSHITSYGLYLIFAAVYYSIINDSNVFCNIYCRKKVAASAPFAALTESHYPIASNLVP